MELSEHGAAFAVQAAAALDVVQVFAVHSDLLSTVFEGEAVSAVQVFAAVQAAALAVVWTAAQVFAVHSDLLSTVFADGAVFVAAQAVV